MSRKLLWRLYDGLVRELDRASYRKVSLLAGEQKMTDQEIRDRFDQDLDMTFNRLSELSGKTLEELRIILSE